MKLKVSMIVAHRGASHDAPENTLAAFLEAWRQGADAIEGDFRLTKDGRIVCMHDETTGRTAGADLVAAKSTLAQLRQLDVGSWKGGRWAGERIPTIEEVLATVPEGKKVFFEIKSGLEILPPLKEAIGRSKVKPEQCVIIAFDTGVIAEAKRRLPGTKTLWLTFYGRDPQTGQWSPSLQQVLATLQEANADGLDTSAQPCVDRSFVEALRAKNLEIHVWTVDDLATASRFQGLGARSLTTNRPGWLREQLHAG